MSLSPEDEAQVYGGGTWCRRVVALSLSPASSGSIPLSVSVFSVSVCVFVSLLWSDSIPLSCNQQNIKPRSRRRYHFQRHYWSHCSAIVTTWFNNHRDHHRFTTVGIAKDMKRKVPMREGVGKWLTAHQSYSIEENWDRMHQHSSTHKWYGTVLPLS